MKTTMDTTYQQASATVSLKHAETRSYRANKQIVRDWQNVLTIAFMIVAVAVIAAMATVYGVN